MNVISSILYILYTVTLKSSPSLHPFTLKFNGTYNSRKYILATYSYVEDNVNIVNVSIYIHHF